MRNDLSRRVRIFGLAALALFCAAVLFYGPSVGSAQPAETTALPDLVPTALELAPSDVGPGDAARLHAVIVNQGAADARGFWVLFRADVSIVGSQFVPGLPVGGQVELEVPWIVAAGEITLRVEVDVPDRVEESDEENNVLARSLVFGADLVLTELALEPRYPRPGEATLVRATIQNMGARDVTESFAVEFAAGRRTFGTRFFSGLARGETLTVEATWTPGAGEQLLRVEVDPFRAITESDERNNLVTQIVDVSPLAPTGADLAVSEVELLPTSPEAGQTVSLRATVVNAGTGPASDVEVAFQVDGETFSTQTVTLEAGETAELSAPWTPTAGERTLRVVIDAPGVLPEPDEEDNAAALTVEIGPPLSACGQYAFLDVRDEETMALFVKLTGLSREAIEHVFLPQVKRVMEIQYEGVNIRFTLRRPPRAHATLLFSPENRRSILGLASIGVRFGTGNVFVGSFAANRSLLAAPLNRLAVIVGSVASHELGHLLGLQHTSQNSSGDIMSANAELAPFSGAGIPKFTPEALRRLQRLLPLECTR